jgi:hypothetical protein
MSKNRFPPDTEMIEWREGRIRPVPGNPPHDRPVSRGCLLVKEDLRPSLPRHSFPIASKNNTEAYGMRFLRDSGIYHPDVVFKVKTKPWGGTVPPPVGRPRAQVKERAGRITPSSSYAMSSDRLILDRVARQHCPSPLHRHTQINMHFSEPWVRGDISTLPAGGHFYFALTSVVGCTSDLLAESRGSLKRR